MFLVFLKFPILILRIYLPAETVCPLLLVAFHFIDLNPEFCFSLIKIFNQSSSNIIYSNFNKTI